jgi:predicted AlkP superfamily phosphohydrolase/phosphomutase
MRYLRMLSNSVVAAALASAYLLALVLALNPAVPLTSSALWPLVATVGLYYAAHLTVVAYAILVARQILARELFSPAWISVGVLVWLGALAAATGTVISWRNLRTFELVLDPASIEALVRSSFALGVSAVLFAVTAIVRWTAPDARIVWATMLVMVMGGSIAAPIALRGNGTAPVLAARPIDAILDAPPVERPARVTLIAIDGGSLDFVTSATAEGRLPNFGKLLDTGAIRHLATLHPTSAEAVWAAVATGKLPQKNGVHSAGVYRIRNGGEVLLQLLPEYCFAHGLVRLGFLIEEAHPPTTFRARTLWSILSAHGITVGVVGWPLTQPAPAVRGFAVSDAYHRIAQMPSEIETPSTVYPPDLQRDATAAMDSAIADASTGEENSSRVDRMYERVADRLRAARPVQVTATRYQGLDAIGHHYLRFATPAEFGDVSDDERRRFGPVLERHYAMIDNALGRAMAALGPDDVLIVVSGYGMVPLTFGKRLIEQLIGDPDLSGTHDDAPDGFLIAFGPSVQRGRVQARLSVVDIVPTTLYFLGLPVGRDMDGFVRTDLFKASFLQERPITYIPSYDR